MKIVKLDYPSKKSMWKEGLLATLDPDQLKFVEILAKLMAENEVFKENYTADDYEQVISWLTKLRAQIDITIETLQDGAQQTK